MADTTAVTKNITSTVVDTNTSDRAMAFSNVSSSTSTDQGQSDGAIDGSAMTVNRNDETTNVWESLQDMDPNDPNYKYFALYGKEVMEQIIQAYQALPNGWRRNPNAGTGTGEAPFIHEDGTTVSWKNPNRYEIQRVLDKAAAEAEQVTIQTYDQNCQNNNSCNKVDASTASKLNKYRRMIKSGVPVDAVHQTARREGIDPALIEEKTNDSATNKVVATTTTKLNKYQKMLKSGVPRGAVEATARRDGIENIEQALSLPNSTSLVAGQEEKREGHEVEATNCSATASVQPKAKESTTVKSTDRPSNPAVTRAMAKYRRMHKTGVPLFAIENAARLDGIIDPARVAIDLGQEFRRLSLENSSSDSSCSTTTLPTLGTAAISYATLGTSTSDEVKEACNNGYFYRFEERPGHIAFEITDKNKRLVSLVRKMVQTVSKRPRQDVVNETRQLLLVSSDDLYNALGAFKGVQNARDLYNSTIVKDTRSTTYTMPEMEQRSKQQPFLELLSSLGIQALPRTHMDIVGLDDVVEFIQHDNMDKIKEIEQNTSVGMYNFDSLGQLYVPGSKVLAKSTFASGIDMMCEVVWNRYEQGRTITGNISRMFKVCFQFVVAVGQHFTLAEFVETFDNFDGRRSIISNLNFIPLSVYSDDEVSTMKRRFQSRGHMYSKCAVNRRHDCSRDSKTSMSPSTTTTQNLEHHGGGHFLAYHKGSFYPKASSSVSSMFGRRHDPSANVGTAHASSGRIMVDVEGAYDAGHSLSVGYDPMVMGIKYKYKEYMLYMRTRKQQEQEEQQRQHDHSTTTRQSSSSSNANMTTMILFDNVPEEYLEMTWPAIIGFSFEVKSWGDVLVDGLSSIDFQDSVFDQLVLPESRKRMVKALVRQTTTSSSSPQSSSSPHFQDLIRGKGEGIVFLLYGPPGVGKTLTAEAVSEMLHRPLYTVSLGQLGMTPQELETKLGDILHLCSRWNALVLLDEADLFLEKRSSNSSLERNAMVSVMLRLVEYFQGTLFLTSNRVETLDPAFKTRITLALKYSALDTKGRQQVWNNLLTACGYKHCILFDVNALSSIQSNDTCISEEGNATIDTWALARHSLNGREIKNAIRLAIALAKEQETEQENSKEGRDDGDDDENSSSSNNNDGDYLHDKTTTYQNLSPPKLTQELIEETVSILLEFNDQLDTVEAY